jgi:hypothetical protein
VDMDFELIHNEDGNQYEFHIEGKVAKIEYILKPPKIYLTHTEVPSSFEKQGIGSQLVLKVLEELKMKKLAIVPLCPFVAASIKKHPEWIEIVDNRYHIK